MQTAFILLLAALTLSHPLLLLLCWIQRFTRQSDDARQWRTSLIWIGLAAATVAVVAFWVGIQYAPTEPRQNDLLFRRFVRVSLLMGFTALLTAIIGQGRERKWIATAALITPLSWFWALIVM